MAKKSREPQLPVSKKRAKEHAILAMRRAWAGDTREFKAWNKYQIDPEPLVIYDLNGQILFYEFTIKDAKKVVGSIKTAASKIIGAPVVTMEFGERSWDADKATKAAKKQFKKLFPNATVKETELVCYSYPKIGIRVFFNKDKNVIFDIASMELIERYASDASDDFACRSFYTDISESDARNREKKWDIADKELEQIRATTPKALQTDVSARDVVKLKDSLLLQPSWEIPTNIMIPATRSKTLRFSPRCSAHECFELVAQQTSVYCAVATGQMILDFYRYHYTQDEIATAMSTGAGGTTNPNQVNGYESLSNNALDATYDGSANWVEARNEINANRPLKSGISGHARACAGWKQEQIYMLGKTPKRWLKIYDPWPWNANICKGGRVYWESWDAVNHTNFIYVRHS